MRRATGKKNKGCLTITVFMVCFALVILCIAYFKGPEIVERGYRIYYPLDYEEEILQYSGEYELDSFLVMGIIRAESNFDQEALSSAGAIGLMQIMPETGQWLAGKMDIGDFYEDMLYDAEFNIHMGCYYLRLLIDYYGETDTAVAAYNAGMGTVSGWLEDNSYSYDGVLLYYIPYTETREYVEKVNKNTDKYLELYGDTEE